MSSSLLSDLIESLQFLPGVGPKSAQRIAFHLMGQNRNIATHLQAKFFNSTPNAIGDEYRGSNYCSWWTRSIQQSDCTTISIRFGHLASPLYIGTFFFSCSKSLTAYEPALGRTLSFFSFNPYTCVFVYLQPCTILLQL